mgnify:CR=1 FL=1
MRKEDCYVDERKLDRLYQKYKAKIEVWNIFHDSRNTQVYIPDELVMEYSLVLGLDPKRIRAEGIWHLLNFRRRLLDLPQSHLDNSSGSKGGLRKLLEVEFLELRWTDNPCKEEGDTRRVLDVSTY